MTLAGYSGMGWTCNAAPFGNSDYVTCTNPDRLPVNASYPDLALSVDVDPGSPSQVTNTAYLSAPGGFDQNGANDVAADPTTILPAPPPVPEADLSVSFTSVSPDPAQSGSTILYAATVANAGPDVATQTTLTDTLPAAVAFASVNPSAGSCTAPSVGQTGEVVCDLGAIGSGQSATVLLAGAVTAAPHTTITNTLSVASIKTDPNAADNVAMVATAVTSIPCSSLQDGSWQSPSTWSCGRVPLATDDVSISHHVTLDADAEATDVSLEGGGELAVPGSATLSVRGNWTNGGGVFTPGSGTVIFDKAGAARLQLLLVWGGVETFCHVQVAASTLLDTGDDALATAPGCAVAIGGAISRTPPYALIDGATPASLAHL